MNEQILMQAFRKLLTYSYFEKNDLIMRRNVADYVSKLDTPSREKEEFEKILSVINGKNDKLLHDWLDAMHLAYYPKSLNTKVTNNQIITNIPSDDTLVDRLLVRCDIPVELLIIDVAWILLYGYQIDAELDNTTCFANRLDLCADRNNVKEGNALFIKYHNQYRKWWNSGLKKANDELSHNENISILNFDIQNCYHSIDLDFDKLINKLNQLNNNIDLSTESLTCIIHLIYQKYWQLVSESTASLFNDKGRHPLPLSLLSANIIANWYLQPIDDYIINNYKDIIYYGRYVDDCMIVTRTKSNNTSCLLQACEEEMPGLLEFDKSDDKHIIFAFAKNNTEYEGINKLSIQSKKLYLYRFDCQLPQNSIEQIENEMKERSSEFRFLTDEMDYDKRSLEFVTLVEALDPSVESGRRFNILEDNKFKLAVYLSKLSSRLVFYPGERKYENEVEKISKYFHGQLLIKHYLLWEKIMSVFVLSKNKSFLESFRENVTSVINDLRVEDGLIADNEIGSIKNTLAMHLRESYLLATSLAPNVDTDLIYQKTYMVRMHYNKYPLQEFMSDFCREGALMPKFKPMYNRDYLNYHWMPYYVKYYDIVCMLVLSNPKEQNIHEEAYKIYKHLNNIVDKGSYLDRFLFHPNETNVESLNYDLTYTKLTKGEFNTSLQENQHNNNPITVAVVELDRKENGTLDVIDNFGKIQLEKVYDMQLLLDSVTSINNSDIFILPELSLPIYELRQFCQYSAKKQKAFVAGLEFIVIEGKTVYNFIITCLPITMYGCLDAVPIIRVKHHYAPLEEDAIKGKGYQVGTQDDGWQYLYHWKGHIFTTYYCYELCDILGRSYFKNKIDAMYAPIFNKDTYYFNNIAESWVRDMHAFLIICNVSHFGDSRISQPTSHINMNKMKVKGGNTKRNRIIVLSGELNVNELRQFQQFNMTQRKKYNDEHKNVDSFKGLPPDYDTYKACNRDNRYFVLKNSPIDNDDFFKWIHEREKKF